MGSDGVLCELVDELELWYALLLYLRVDTGHRGFLVCRAIKPFTRA